MRSSPARPNPWSYAPRCGVLSRARRGSKPAMKLPPKDPNENEDGDEPVPKPESYAEAAKQRLAKFLATNSLAAFKDAGSEVFIDKPWGDSSLALTIPPEFEELAKVLDNVYLPEQLSALWHTDTMDLEVIYTAFQLMPSQRELVGRKFKFTYDGATHTCEFTRSSDRLLKIAQHTQPITESTTGHRNLLSFHIYGATPEEHRDEMEPISFWIRRIEWNEDKVVDFARHLNFYMTYFDIKSPAVLLHFKDSGQQVTPGTRYRRGSFPPVITGHTLDENLMSLWAAASSGDAARRFQYYYRIIEYASFFYLEESARAAVKRVIAAPDLMADLGSTVERLMAALNESRMDDVARFNAVLRECVDVSAVWREMAKNMTSFSEPVNFDGGFVLAPIVAPTLTDEQFGVKGCDVFGRAIRELRNALTHGRDTKSAAIILPTRRNFRLLTPWVNVITIAAGDVVLYRNRS